LRCEEHVAAQDQRKKVEEAEEVQDSDMGIDVERRDTREYQHRTTLEVLQQKTPPDMN
jgi:hypothetical protein